MYRFHIKAMTKQGHTITNSMVLLANTLHSLNQYNYWLLYNSCILPMLMYTCMIWYKQHNPQKGYLKQLEKVQNSAL